MYRRLVSIILLLVAVAIQSIAQYSYPDSDTEGKKNKPVHSRNERIFYGGNLGLAFNNNAAYVELSPLMGYKLTPKLWTGGGPKYMYLKRQPEQLQTHDYGIKLFASYTLLDNIDELINVSIQSLFIQCETEILNLRVLYWNPNTLKLTFGDREWHNMTFVGGGLRMPMGDNTGLSLMVLWGITPSTELRYDNPEVRLSIYF